MQSLWEPVSNRNLNVINYELYTSVSRFRTLNSTLWQTQIRSNSVAFGRALQKSNFASGWWFWRRRDSPTARQSRNKASTAHTTRQRTRIIKIESWAYEFQDSVVLENSVATEFWSPSEFSSGDRMLRFGRQALNFGDFNVLSFRDYDLRFVSCLSNNQWVATT